MSTILITGASSGIGQACAAQFRAAGHDVIGLARRADLIPGGVEAVDCDLTSPASIADAFADDALRGRQIDVLVHCAGYGDFAPLELESLDEARRQLEVNVFSAIDIVQRVLPGMRDAGGGRIVLVSSIASEFSSPMGGWYHASKAALESLADALRQEVAEFDIDVAIVRPGVVRTPWHATAMEGLVDSVSGTPYESMGRATARYHERSAESKMVAEVSEVVDVIVEASVGAGRPRTRYTVGRGSRIATLLPRLVSDRTFDTMTRQQFGIR